MELLAISALGFVIGIVTAISGGAGVYAVPTMLALGLPTVNVLALNRISDVAVTLGALPNYHKSGSINWPLAVRAMIPLSIGSFIGANIVVSLPEETLRWIILAGVAVGITFLLRPVPKVSKSRKPLLGFLLLLCVGVWSGSLAMAGATFAVLVLVRCFGFSFLSARGTDVAAAIPETIVSSAVLVAAANVETAPLLCMFFSSLAGASVGSHLAIAKGSQFVRYAMVGIAILMIGKVITGI